MRLASDFRRAAREVLSGKWSIAVVTGVAAVLLGAVEGMGPEAKLNLDGSGVAASFKFAGQQIFSVGTNRSAMGVWLLGSLTYLVIMALIAGVLYFVLGSMISVGYGKFHLNLADRREASFGDLFSYASYWKTALAARLMKSIYVFLWSLLLFIPGIIAHYSYAMTEYILADTPQLSASEAIRISKEMMVGNKWRLFCLEISFIGWDILCSLTLGIGNFWLTPYKQTAAAVFYREVSGTESRIYENENEVKL